MNHDLEWLTSRWQLPQTAVKTVAQLLESEKNGGTALALTAAVSEPASLADHASLFTAWGHAAALSTDTSARTPLVLYSGKNQASFLQSRVLHEAEVAVATRLRHLAQKARRAPADLEARLAKLFPGANPQQGQMAAARLAATGALTLITGGPGTGKTYTLARILVLLLESGIEPAKIRLAAPTGKAAQRMSEAIAESLEKLPEGSPTESLRSIASHVSTMHRLLGYHPGTGRCRTEALPDGTVVILDECSMIDLFLWAALVRILPDDARLILLGDPEQLESVGQGAVLAELAQSPVLEPCRVHLTESHRFRDTPGIQGLARAILQRDAAAACALLEQAREGTPAALAQGLCWYPGHGAGPGGSSGRLDLPVFVQEGQKAIAHAATPEEALEKLSQVCVLAAHRETPWGARTLSRRIQSQFEADEKAQFFPIIIERNDPATGLKNGTVGLIGRPSATSSGEKLAYFVTGQQASGKPTMQAFPASRLPEYQPAWAITIHRSQGSEYEKVLVILPKDRSPLATRELLYTAITRAKSVIGVRGDLETVAKAVESQSPRCTLLGKLLEES